MGGFVTILGTALPYHILSYGTLLGTELYQSFVNTKVCFQELPMREFLILQRRVFPVYFKLQVGLAMLTAATHPSRSILSLAPDPWGAVPLAVVIGMGTLNWLIYGPRTTQCAFVRRALDREEGQAGAGDKKVFQAKRNFTFNHAMCIHLNAIALVATKYDTVQIRSVRKKI
ncbi:Uncharacterized protein PECH_000234 [Penicillium ucsense]|uniref:TMEM205-like domain-containing protein n=1 Tax=Penicillium ucsense TaxID=2839758 RepID=A0A8J8WB30_9EURO|nr:Uncharacterized protein PECM_008561 [Penicillium ucsense]KAF7738515.1 Uncharacterized protein PECH_000234 [Penicillium ucsense]